MSSSKIERGDASDPLVAIDPAAALADPASWLDAILADSTGASPPFSDDAQHRDRLARIPFDAILSALERRRATLTTHAEIAIYKAWIEANIGTSPLLFAAWFNLGVTLARNHDYPNAAIAYRNALVLKPDLYSASVNLGLISEALGEPGEALRIWEQALQPDEARVALLIQRGRLLESIGMLSDAEKTLRTALAIDGSRSDVVHHWVHLRQKLCLWPVTEPPAPDLTSDDLMRRSGPLGILALTDDIEVQATSAASWIARKTRPAPLHLAPRGGYLHERVRVGYLSSDFCRHAMSFLIAELFERHDRARFEIFGYCASKDDGSDLRRRIIGGFDHFRTIRELSDEQAAHAIRRDEIDILIDLNGLTEGTRLDVLRWKPAPIQATYLGFIGAVPLPELDYLLCDDFVIPPDLAMRYSPTPLPIPRIYQANDSKRQIGRAMTRNEVGLPDNRFVFCCFSRHYKITESMFAAWMQILTACDNAVLWIARDNVWSDANLANAATLAGVSQERLIFADRIDPDLYMSRLTLADLFLDTFPYNAGTVASDALRMELPLLTLSGKAYASRMAGSLLRAIGAPEGIAADRCEYIAKALRYATDEAEFRRFRAAFTHAAWAETIGDIARFTWNFEAVLASLVKPDVDRPDRTAAECATQAAA